MSTMAIAWCRMRPGNTFDNIPDHFVDAVIEREVITTSGVTARSTVAPTGADVAIVHAVDAALLVVNGDSSVNASATLGVDVPLGESAYLRVQAGETYIAGIER